MGQSADGLQSRYENEEKICQKIFKNYNYDVSADKLPVRMIPYLAIEHVANLDEQHQTMKLHVVFVLQWLDERLTWIPSDFGNIRKIVRPKMIFQKQNLWTPSVHVTDVGSRSINLIENADSLEVSISSLGIIRVHVRMQVRTTCFFQIGNYPNDLQNCSFSLYTPYDAKQFEFARYGGVEMTKYDLIGTHPDVDFQDFKLDNIQGDGMFLFLGNTVMSKITDADRPFSRSFFRYNLTFQRVNKYYQVRMVIPFICLSMFVVISSFTKGQTGIIWLLVCLLLQIMYAIDLLNALPPDYNDMPLIGVVVIALLFETVFMIIWRVFTIQVVRSVLMGSFNVDPEKRAKVASWITKIIQIGDILLPCLLGLQTIMAAWNLS